MKVFILAACVAVVLETTTAQMGGMMASEGMMSSKGMDSDKMSMSDAMKPKSMAPGGMMADSMGSGIIKPGGSIMKSSEISMSRSMGPAMMPASDMGASMMNSKDMMDSSFMASDEMKSRAIVDSSLMRSGPSMMKKEVMESSFMGSGPLMMNPKGIMDSRSMSSSADMMKSKGMMDSRFMGASGMPSSASMWKSKEMMGSGMMGSDMLSARMGVDSMGARRMSSMERMKFGMEPSMMSRSMSMDAQSGRMPLKSMMDPEMMSSKRMMASERMMGGMMADGILDKEMEIRPDGAYVYKYKTNDGVDVFQEGQMSPARSAEGPAMVVKGMYSWMAPNGHVYKVEYLADEMGYHPRVVSKA